LKSLPDDQRDAFGETCVRGHAVVPDDRFDPPRVHLSSGKGFHGPAPSWTFIAAGEKARQTVSQNLPASTGFCTCGWGLPPWTFTKCSEVRQLEEELILSDLMVVGKTGRAAPENPRKA
jgi:hypothetical protein